MAQPFALSILGQSVSGVFSFQQSKDAGKDGVLGTVDDRTVLRIAATNVQAFVGSGGIDSTGVMTPGSIGAALTAGSGFVLVTPDGLAMSVSGTVTLALGGGVSASVNSAAFQINETTAAVNEQFTVGGSQSTLTLPPGPYFSVSLTGVALTIANQQLHGDVTVTRQGTATAATTTITLANVGLRLGTPQRDFVTVSGGTGTLIIGSGGVYGNLAANVAVSVPGISLSGAFALTLNTTGAPQTLGTGSTAVNVPNGVSVSGAGVSLDILGQTLTGDVGFSYDSTNKVVGIGLSNVTLNLGDGTTTFVSATVTQGAILLRNDGIAGQLTVALTTPGIPSSVLSFNGTATLTINTTPGPVSGSINVGHGTVAINITQGGPFLQVELGSAASPINLSILGQTLSGHFWFQQLTTANGNKIVAIGFDHAGLKLGVAPLALQVGCLPGDPSSVICGQGAFELDAGRAWPERSPAPSPSVRASP